MIISTKEYNATARVKHQLFNHLFIHLTIRLLVNLSIHLFIVARSFSGNSYMKMKMPHDLHGKRTKVVLNIRPAKKAGVLLYTDSKDNGDFLGLFLKDGYVIYRYKSDSFILLNDIRQRTF